MNDLEISRHEEIIKLEKLKLKVDVWKTVIDVQKHFNDLEMKVRNFGILILSAFIGAIGVSFNSDSTFTFLGGNYSVAVILALGASVVWMLFYFVDVYWYHPLLLGAVKKGLDIESEISLEIPNINLTKTIGDKSPKNILCWKNMHSTGKANLFYFGVLFVLLSSAISLVYFKSPDKSNQLNNLKFEASCTRNDNYNGVSCIIASPSDAIRLK
ncbi:hypothetical protein I5L37_19075 [Serratia marcescens]|uniref:hypothetical protein n=1 Tax=Serratia marcescens TaxID=615 RepID=UPI000445BBE7|nr:hypothetical protein [Serratia marcescens]EIJ9189311.1 hypothetical protein [Serratia marcescens]ELX7490280.1 hypothetical protein [Serratia marcescens]EZQ67827.1 hypothetical protein AF53_03975 [Serratia marcescens BIDMC 80]MBH2566001.1 hypothetical protein [Serratia marcescens]MBH2793318.1 hypothetical protein [Serratia marcescens]